MPNHMLPLDSIPSKPPTPTSVKYPQFTLLPKAQGIPRGSLPPSLPAPTHYRLSSTNSIPPRPQRILCRLASSARRFRRVFDAVAVVARAVTPGVGCIGYSAKLGVSGMRIGGWVLGEGRIEGRS